MARIEIDGRVILLDEFEAEYLWQHLGVALNVMEEALEPFEDIEVGSQVERRLDAKAAVEELYKLIDRSIPQHRKNAINAKQLKIACAADRAARSL